MKKHELNELIVRLKLFFGIENDIQLSRKLGKFDAYIAQCKKRGSIDFESIFTTCYNADFNWLITGDADKPMEMVLIDDQDNRHVTDRVSLISSQEKDQVEYLRAILTETQKQLYETQKMLYEYQKQKK